MSWRASICCLVALAGCASSEPDLSSTSEVIQDRLGQPATWVTGPEAESPVEVTVRGLIAHELSAEDAIRIALLRNMELQAFYEDLGIAEADLVAASLPKNPTMHADALVPDTSPRATGLELEFSQDLLSVFTIPGRRSIAEAQLTQTRANVTAQVIELASKVRSAYFELQGATQGRAVLARAVEAAGAALEYAQALHHAGNLRDLDLADQQAELAQAEVELAKAELEVVDGRERLNGLMGLWGPDTAWAIPAKLPDLPQDDLLVERLESLAVEQRLDLEAAKAEAERLARSLDMARTFRFTPGLSVGVAADRDTDGQWAIGPHVEVTLPLFDHGQADTARLLAQLRQAEKRYAALAVNVRAEVRRLRDRLVAVGSLARRYRDRLLPARRDVVARTLEHYNYMLEGTFDLLTAKRQEIGAERDYVEALEQYWVTRSELARVLGGRWLAVASVPQVGAPPRPPPEDEHQGHGNH